MHLCMKIIVIYKNFDEKFVILHSVSSWTASLSLCLFPVPVGTRLPQASYSSSSTLFFPLSMGLWAQTIHPWVYFSIFVVMIKKVHLYIYWHNQMYGTYKNTVNIIGGCKGWYIGTLHICIDLRLTDIYTCWRKSYLRMSVKFMTESYYFIHNCSLGEVALLWEPKKG